MEHLRGEWRRPGGPASPVAGGERSEPWKECPERE